MTDGQNWGWRPEQGYGRQYGQGQPWQGQPWQGQPWQGQPWQGQPWQAAQDGSGARQGHSGGPQYPPQPPYPPPNPPTQVLYGPPGGPRGRKPWPARHKVLTALLGFCGLVFIIGIAAAASSSSSSTPAATSSLIVKTPTATASPTATKTATAPRTATTAPPTTPAPPATQAQTAAAVQRTAPSTPAQTTSAAPPAPPASTAPASCYPLSNEGTCYEPGEFCRKADHGKSGVAGDGKAIECEDNDGWRWEPV